MWSLLLSSLAFWKIDWPRRADCYAARMGDVDRLVSAEPQRETPAAELLPLVYEELRRLAAAKMAREPSGDTFQATALVHEAWLRLNGNGSPRFENRTHFFGAAAEAMRRILIERASQRLAAKRGGGIEPLDIHEMEIASPAKDDAALLALDEALEKFAAIDPRKAELVKLRYYVGLNFEETATALGIAVPTAKQWWAYSRAWLTVEMRNAANG